MGAAMAIRVARAGEDLTIWNRTSAKCAPVAEAGGTVAGSIAELRERDVVFTMVSTGGRSRAGVLRRGRAAGRRHGRPGIVVDCSTVSTESSAAIREPAVSAAWSFSPPRSVATPR